MDLEWTMPVGIKFTLKISKNNQVLLFNRRGVGSSSKAIEKQTGKTIVRYHLSFLFTSGVKLLVNKTLFGAL